MSEGQTLFVANFQVIGGHGSSSAIQITGCSTPIELFISRKIIPTTTTSGLVAVRAVTPGTPGVIIPAENQLKLWYESPEGTSWEIEGSNDLIHWTSVGTGVVDSENSLATISILLRANQRQYYRAVQIF